MQDVVWQSGSFSEKFIASSITGEEEEEDEEDEDEDEDEEEDEEEQFEAQQK